MSVNTEKAKQTYIANGEMNFLIGFPFLNPTDIKVYSLNEKTLSETELTIEEDYTVYVVPSTGNGYISITEKGLGKIPVGNTLTIIRRPSVTQETSLTENDPFYVSTIENMADKLTYIALMLKEDLERSVKYPVGLSRKPDYAELSATIEKAYLAAKNAEELTIRAEEAAQSIDKSVENAETEVEKAMKWAVNPENVPVEDGKFSAYHYAMQIKNSSDFATAEEALAGQSATKVMTPLVTKLASAYYASPDYTNNEYKDWNVIYKAEKSGLLLCECGVGKTSTGALFCLEVSNNATMSRSFPVISADCLTATIFQSYIVPISKGTYYRASGGLPQRNLYFIPSTGEA